MHRVTTRHHKIRVDIISNREVRIVDPIWVETKELPLILRVPAGYKTDGASVPQIFWALGFTPFALDTLRGAVAHDYMYRECKMFIERKLADRVFLAMMKESKAPFIKRHAYYIMVRLFGWISRDLTPKLKKFFKRRYRQHKCKHDWEIYKCTQLPMYTEHIYEMCDKCLKRRDYYKNPWGTFTL